MNFKDINWHAHHTNNIEDNPIDQIYVIFDYGDEEGNARKYSIHFQYKMDNNFTTLYTNDYTKAEYFIVKDARGHKDKNVKDFQGYKFEEEKFHHVFSSLEEAKRFIKEFCLKWHFRAYELSFILDEEELKETVSKYKII